MAVAPIIEEFRITWDAVEHIELKHGVSREEALEAASSCSRHSRTYSTSDSERRYIIAGKTGDGRRLWIVFADEGNRIGRIITAYEPQSDRSIARHRHAFGS